MGGGDMAESEGEQELEQGRLGGVHGVVFGRWVLLANKAARGPSRGAAMAARRGGQGEGARRGKWDNRDGRDFRDGRRRDGGRRRLRSRSGAAS